MLEIVGDPAAFATGLVDAAGADDHLEPGRRAGFVADEKQMLAQALLSGYGGTCWQREGEEERARRERLPKTARHPKAPSAPNPAKG
jgi:hypothetical protein